MVASVMAKIATMLFIELLAKRWLIFELMLVAGCLYDVDYLPRYFERY